MDEHDLIREEKVDILGTKYDLYRGCDLRLEGADGTCDFYKKTIRIGKSKYMLDGTSTAEDRAERTREVVRHEIIHAYLHESGMSKFEEDEDLVDWITMQYKKLRKTFKQLACEEEP